MSEAVAIVTINTSVINDAIPRMIAQSKQELGDMMRNEVAKPLVRKIISITPPQNGSVTGLAAKKAGETAIKDDIGRIMRPAPQSYIDVVRRIWGGDVHVEQFGHAGASPIGAVYERILSGGDIAKFHDERRSKTTGRVGFRGSSRSAQRNASLGRSDLNRNRAQRMTTGVRARDLRMLDVGLVLDTEFHSYVAQMQKRVGLLGAGWNAGAQELGVSRPSWISRHGTNHGQCHINLDGDQLSIVITNDIAYVNQVRDLERRVQTAVDWQGRDMNRRIDAFARKERAL